MRDSRTDYKGTELTKTITKKKCSYENFFKKNFVAVRVSEYEGKKYIEGIYEIMATALDEKEGVSDLMYVYHWFGKKGIFCKY